MFEEIIFMVGFAVFSIIISYILLKYTPVPLDKLIRVLAALGIIIHELSHGLMCVLTNTRIKSMNLLVRSKEGSRFGLRYGGKIELKDYVKLTLLQALLIGFAPVYISFWLFFFLWEQLKNPNLDVFVFYIYLFVMVSLVLSAAPSFADLLAVFGAFHFDWRYSLYQIGLVLLSVGTVWLIITYYQIQVFHEIVTYISIFAGYHGFKTGAKGLKTIYLHFLRKRRGLFSSRKTKTKSLTRRRVTPVKTSDEAQW
jgi:hypothetical protein